MVRAGAATGGGWRRLLTALLARGGAVDAPALLEQPEQSWGYHRPALLWQAVKQVQTSHGHVASSHFAGVHRSLHGESFSFPEKN